MSDEFTPSWITTSDPGVSGEWGVVRMLLSGKKFMVKIQSSDVICAGLTPHA